VTYSNDDTHGKPLRSVLALSLLVVALAISVLYALVGTGGVTIFGFGSNLRDTYYLVTPLLLPLTLLICLLSIRWMVILLLIHLTATWITGLDTWSLSIVLLALAAYLLFPTQLRRGGVIAGLRSI
jgi:hypothetical protein